MKSFGRRAARVLSSVAPLLLLAAIAPAPQPRHQEPAPQPAAAPSVGQTPTAKGETRLRKLHLVRPDLIPYPIAFEVYC